MEKKESLATLQSRVSVKKKTKGMAVFIGTVICISWYTLMYKTQNRDLGPVELPGVFLFADTW